MQYEYRVVFTVAALVKACTFSNLRYANEAAVWFFQHGYAPSIERRGV